MNCRCGYDASRDADHPCHRCGKAPGTRRLYVSTFKFSLAGVQPKLSMAETWGCDSCWAEFKKLLDANPDR